MEGGEALAGQNHELEGVPGSNTGHGIKEQVNTLERAEVRDMEQKALVLQDSQVAAHFRASPCGRSRLVEVVDDVD